MKRKRHSEQKKETSELNSGLEPRYFQKIPADIIRSIAAFLVDVDTNFLFFNIKVICQLNKQFSAAVNNELFKKILAEEVYKFFPQEYKVVRPFFNPIFRLRQGRYIVDVYPGLTDYIQLAFFHARTICTGHDTLHVLDKRMQTCLKIPRILLQCGRIISADTAFNQLQSLSASNWVYLEDLFTNYIYSDSNITAMTFLDSLHDSRISELRIDKASPSITELEKLKSKLIFQFAKPQEHKVRTPETGSLSYRIKKDLQYHHYFDLKNALDSLKKAKEHDQKKIISEISSMEEFSDRSSMVCSIPFLNLLFQFKLDVIRGCLYKILKLTYERSNVPTLIKLLIFLKEKGLVAQESIQYLYSKLLLKIIDEFCLHYSDKDNKDHIAKSEHESILWTKVELLMLHGAQTTYQNLKAEKPMNVLQCLCLHPVSFKVLENLLLTGYANPVVFDSSKNLPIHYLCIHHAKWMAHIESDSSGKYFSYCLTVIKLTLVDKDNILEDSEEDMINEQNQDGDTPLMAFFQSMESAYSRYYYQFIEFLLEQGADLTLTNLVGDCPLILFVKHAKGSNEFITSVIRLLVSTHGADLFCTDGNNCNILHYLKLNNDWSPQAEMNLQFILEKIRSSQSADQFVNQKNSDGYTPFLSAVEGNNIDTIPFLRRLGADPSIKTNNGETALHLLARFFVINKVEDPIKIAKDFMQWGIVASDLNDKKRDALTIAQNSIREIEPENVTTGHGFIQYLEMFKKGNPFTFISSSQYSPSSSASSSSSSSSALILRSSP